jgi:hypothetical protein
VVEEIHLLYASFDDLLFAEEVVKAEAISRWFDGNDVGQDHLLLAVPYDISTGLTHLNYPPRNKDTGGWKGLSTQHEEPTETGYY